MVGDDLLVLFCFTLNFDNCSLINDAISSGSVEYSIRDFENNGFLIFYVEIFESEDVIDHFEDLILGITDLTLFYHLDSVVGGAIDCQKVVRNGLA